MGDVNTTLEGDFGSFAEALEASLDVAAKKVPGVVERWVATQSEEEQEQIRAYASSPTCNMAALLRAIRARGCQAGQSALQRYVNQMQENSK